MSKNPMCEDGVTRREVAAICIGVGLVMLAIGALIYAGCRWLA